MWRRPPVVLDSMRMDPKFRSQISSR